MLNNEQLIRLKEKYSSNGLSLENERAKIRSAYKEVDSRLQFKRLCINCRLFSRIELDDVEKLARRNLAVSMLEDMGFFDEKNLDLIFDFFFSLPMVGELEENKEEEI